MSATDDLVIYITELLEESGGATEMPEDVRNAILPIVSRIRAEAIRETAEVANPPRPEVSFFGIYGPQVADWLRRIADSKAVGER